MPNISSSPLRVIAMVGDSHTWGEGVGAEYGFVPPVVGADKRMTGFGYPNYVNLIRDAVNARTGSSAAEYGRERLAALCGRESRGCGVLGDGETLTLPAPFRLARVFLFAGDAPVTVTVRALGADGAPIGEPVVLSGGDMVCADPSPAVCVRFCHVFADGASALTVAASGGDALIQRVELYDGPYAVVNCGVGSCPAGRYLDVFFDRYVAPLRPYAAVWEGSTINDWLSGETLDDYAAALRRTVSALRALTPRVLAHSVFPIAGSQFAGNATAPYTAFSEIMKDTLTSPDVALPFVDTYAVFLDELARVPETHRGRFLYHDPWHPNGTGHYIYARELYPRMEAWLEED